MARKKTSNLGPQPQHPGEHPTSLPGSLPELAISKDDWYPMEHYFREHFNIRFSHGICPVCMTTVARAAI